MSKLTAETITDEQIRELYNAHTACSSNWDPEIVDVADIALGTYDGSSLMSGNEARARCAEILNARKGGNNV